MIFKTSFKTIPTISFPTWRIMALSLYQRCQCHSMSLCLYAIFSNHLECSGQLKSHTRLKVGSYCSCPLRPLQYPTRRCDKQKQCSKAQQGMRQGHDWSFRFANSDSCVSCRPSQVAIPVSSSKAKAPPAQEAEYPDGRWLFTSLYFLTERSLGSLYHFEFACHCLPNGTGFHAQTQALAGVVLLQRCKHTNKKLWKCNCWLAPKKV